MIYSLEIIYKNGNSYNKTKRNVEIEVHYTNDCYYISFGDDNFIFKREDIINFDLKRIA